MIGELLTLTMGAHMMSHADNGGTTHSGCFTRVTAAMRGQHTTQEADNIHMIRILPFQTKFCGKEDAAF